MMQFTGILCWDLLCAYAHVMVHKCNGSDCCHTVSYGVRLYRYNAEALRSRVLERGLHKSLL